MERSSAPEADRDWSTQSQRVRWSQVVQLFKKVVSAAAIISLRCKTGPTEKKPIQSSFWLERIRIDAANGAMPPYEGEEGEIGNNIANHNTNSSHPETISSRPQRTFEIRQALTQKRTDQSVQC